MKAISPVIATVIIVAVAIAIAVAVAFWMTGITGTFTRYEKLEITYAYARWDNSTQTWNVTLKVQNTGPSDATIVDILINGIPISSFEAGQVSIYTSIAQGISIPSGSSVELHISLVRNGFVAGQTIEIKLLTAAGNEYPKQVTLL